MLLSSFGLSSTNGCGLVIIKLHNNYTIRNAGIPDLRGALDLERKVWGAMAASDSQLSNRFKIYPQGQFIVLDPDERFSGMVNSFRCKEAELQKRLREPTGNFQDKWNQLTDNGAFQNVHDPGGNVLFLANLSTLPREKTSALTRAELGHSLMNQIFLHAKQSGLSKIYGLTRLNGFAEYQRKKPQATVQDYVAAVERNELRDPALSFHLRMGAKVLSPVANAMALDNDSLGWGALIVYSISP